VHGPEPLAELVIGVVLKPSALGGAQRPDFRLRHAPPG
jgi:hypothetical protein